MMSCGVRQGGVVSGLIEENAEGAEDAEGLVVAGEAGGAVMSWRDKPRRGFCCVGGWTFR
jgi:hypothetical protein